PEGTIDSELFGHEKGAFTGATSDRKGYFEEANGGTIFLDEVGELPLSTQVRLLRVLETGEYIRVGSSKTQKTDVRVVTATNLNMQQATMDGRFREDLYYRLNAVPIVVPALRERKEDIELLFRKFAYDFSEKYNMPPVRLMEDAKHILTNYYWNGNIRQLKNITEQISVIEHNREISASTLQHYLPKEDLEYLPALLTNHQDTKSFNSEREILYQVLFDMRKDINDLKKMVGNVSSGNLQSIGNKEDMHFSSLLDNNNQVIVHAAKPIEKITKSDFEDNFQDVEYQDDTVVPNPLTLNEMEKQMIAKTLNKYRGRRKPAAEELHISERTLYRKIKEYELE
ncbi:MAG: sigma 54-interacting transcriptional regulator, partial [Prevotellaceae bacterium]|nr:sigma 54-interacting transcriptional regulator [Prevotellaceae bacterium]